MSHTTFSVVREVPATSRPTEPTSTIGRYAGRRLLGVWAHPDDEAYLAAGLMAEWVESGGTVTLIAMTDGELGFPESDRRPAHLRGAQRRAELAAAMSSIGVHDIRFLGIPDGSVADEPRTLLSLSIRMVIDEVRPDVITTFGPDGVTGHPDHIVTGEATTRAWMETRCGELWYAAKTPSWLDDWRELHDRFGVWMTDEPVGVEPGDLEVVIDLADRTLDRKRRVLAAHGSQTVGLSEAFGEDAYRSWICQEAFRSPTTAELFDVDPTLCLANWCHPWGQTAVWPEGTPKVRRSTGHTELVSA